MAKRQRVYDGFFKIDRVKTIVGWREVMVETDAISIFLYDEERRRVLLIRQPRPGCINAENPNGLVTETVAGRFDGDYSVRELAIKEAKEEAGVDLDPADVGILNRGNLMTISAGATTGKTYLAYAKIRPGKLEFEERVFGAQDEGESIERLWIPVDDLPNFQCEDLRVFALIQWFLRTQYTHHNPYIAALQKLLRKLGI